MTNPAAEVSTDRPELVVGLVGAVGTDLDVTADLLGEILRTFGYHVADTISLSRLLDHVQWDVPLPGRESGHYDEYVGKRMTAGDKVRRNLRFGGALVQMAVHEVVLQRAQILERSGGEAASTQPGNVAYILRSLKHEKEVEALRKIYGNRLVVIGAHAPRQQRTDDLAELIAKSYASTDRARFNQHAERLAHRDEEEEGDDYGQHVRKTFPLADFFVDVSHRHRARENLERFVNAYFGWPYASPNRDEYTMFHAQAASARSADLSRQVGAAVVSKNGDLISVGCNEVPRFGGGAYWEDDPDDKRDFQRGEDANQLMRDVIVDEIRKVLEAEWFSEAAKGRTLEEFRTALGDARVKQLTEFNRAMHAEMAALLDAARRGASVRGATLHTTTFPCHNCAKHIVGAGIERVVYVAPYAKSLAEKLHPDTIAIDHGHRVDGKVTFEPFVGVAPSLYLPLFTKGDIERKDTGTGKTVGFNPLKARPKLVPHGDFSYLRAEKIALHELHESLQRSVKLEEEGNGEAVRLTADRQASLDELRPKEEPVAQIDVPSDESK